MGFDFISGPNFIVPSLGSTISSDAHGYLGGLTMSAFGGTATFAVTAGAAADVNNVDMMVLPTIYSKTTGSWVAGTGNGALDSGVIASSTWYHTFLIKSAVGVTDLLVSTSLVSPVMPSGYYLNRRVGSMKTDASSLWTAFYNIGDYFYWNTVVQDVGATNPGTTAVVRTLTCPPGVQTIVLMEGLVVTGTTFLDCRVNVSPLNVSDEAASGYNLNIGFFGASGFQNAYHYECMTNTASQVRTRNSNSDAGTQLFIGTRGWIDCFRRFV